jgi:hypothetical protein
LPVKQSLANRSFSSLEYEISSSVFHLYPVFSIDGILFFDPPFLFCAHTEKADGFRTNGRIFEGVRLKCQPKPVS